MNINNDDVSLEFFSKTFIRKDRNNSGGGLLIYFKDDIFAYMPTLERLKAVEGLGFATTPPLPSDNCFSEGRKMMHSVAFWI